MGWHYNDLTEKTGAPAAEVFGDPVGYVFNAQRTQHVISRTIDNRVLELCWDSNGWRYNDLNAASGGAPAPDLFVRCAYMFDPEGTQHVVYVAGHIIELWKDSNGWHYNDLTIAAGGVPQILDTPHGYAFNSQATQHVVYMPFAGQGVDGHIIELWWDSNGWHHNDLTIAAGGAPLAGGRPSGYVFDAQQTQHVVYKAESGHVVELWWDSSGWHHNDLTLAAGGAPLPASNPTGYVFSAQGTQHVVYLGADAHIHELWWDSSGWHHNDLTAVAGAPLAGSDPVGYPFNAQGTQHVIYVASDPPGHMIELWWNGGWHHNDLTVAAGGAPLGATRPAGYVFDAQGTQHVFYYATDGQGIDGHIIELWSDLQ
jgi:hypothetical protein